MNAINASSLYLWNTASGSRLEQLLGDIGLLLLGVGVVVGVVWWLKRRGDGVE